MERAKLSVDEFCAQLAARTPVPGGGAVAAVTAAHAAALLAMVVEFSLGKPKLAEHQPALQKALATLGPLRTRALQLVDEDAAAYGALNALWKVPKDHPTRIEQWDATVRAAILAPQAILDLAAEVAALGASLAGCTNPQLGSDLAIARDLAAVAARAAAHNVAVNLPSLTCATERAQRHAAMEAALARAGAA